MRTFDYTKLKERSWDSETLGYVAQIHEFKGRQQLYLEQNPAALDRLVDGGFLVRHGRGRAAFYTRADAK